MEEFAIVFLIVALCVSIGAASVYVENNDQKHCKSMGMVKVTYSHDSYCARVEDLKK